MSFLLKRIREFKVPFNVPGNGMLNGSLNDDSLATISELEDTVLTLLKENNHMNSTEKDNVKSSETYIGNICVYQKSRLKSNLIDYIMIIIRG